jgi:hypothetical protein
MLFKQYTNLSVKIIGPSIGNIGKPIIDGDNDGKCQEENGNWIPCPPGTGAIEALQRAASIKPWERPFEAGKWEKVDARDHKLSAILKDLADANPNVSPDILNEKAQSLVAGMGLEGQSVFVNGPVTFSPNTLNNTSTKEILKQIDDLYRVNPPKNRLNITITENLPYNVDGATYPVFKETDEIRVELDRKVFSRDERLPARPKVPSGNKPHNQNTVSIEKRKWVLTHEWGHVIDTRHMEQGFTQNTPLNVLLKDGLFLLYKNSPDAGGYASENQYEMYAESFADWVTSKGKSTNLITLAYAKYFGWNAS